MAAGTPWMPSPAIFPPPLQPNYQGSAAGSGAGVDAAPQHGSGGSIGTFFAVLAAVLVLTMLSCIFGRVCAGRAEGPDERYDCTRLAIRWCCWWRTAPPRRIVRREEKPPVGEVPAALPPPEP